MRALLPILPVFLLFAGCSKPLPPEAVRAAECLAVFNIGDYWLKKGAPLKDQISMEARAFFEMEKLHKMGMLKESKRHTETYTREHFDDEKRTNALLLECGNAQDRDPEMKRRERALMIHARRTNPACRADKFCAVKPGEE